jgi:hypothetical protein
MSAGPPARGPYQPPPARPRKAGQLFRLAPDINIENGQGAWITANAAAGVFGYVGLFNNSPTGQLLAVWACYLHVPTLANNQFLFHLGGINPGGSGSSGTATAGSLAPTRAGITFSGSPTSLLATTDVFWGCAMDTNSPAYEWVSDYPLCLVPPNMSLVIQNSVQNNAIQCALRWQVHD